MMVRNLFTFNAFGPVLCCAVLFLAAAVTPAGAQYPNDPGSQAPTQTPTPAAAMMLSPETEETPVPGDFYMPKIFVPTNTPPGDTPPIVIPHEFCQLDPEGEQCDRNDADINLTDLTGTISEIHLTLEKAKSFTGTYGNIYKNTCNDPICRLIVFNSTKPSIDLGTKYDSSTGSTGINAENTRDSMEAAALQSSSGHKVDTYLLNASVDLFNRKPGAAINAKIFDVDQTGSEAAINVFGNASVKVIPAKEAPADTKAAAVDIDAVKLAANGGRINVNVGAVKAEVSDADQIAAEGVSITTDDNAGSGVTFTSGRLGYYYFDKWRNEDETEIPEMLPDKIEDPEFTVTSSEIEGLDAYDEAILLKYHPSMQYDICYFTDRDTGKIIHKDTGEVLYAARNRQNPMDEVQPQYFEAVLNSCNVKQCEQVYPGDITISAAGNSINACGARLTAGSGKNTIHFETTNGGGINVAANGSDGTAYGLYTDSAGGTINALIEGSITESGINKSDLGNNAGIAMAGESGLVSIQVGVKPAELPAGEKEIMVSGSRVGIYNLSGAGQTKNAVIFGTVTGPTAPILTAGSGSGLTLSVWKILPVKGSVAFKIENGTPVPDPAFEQKIRYILLTDPSVPEIAEIGSATDTAPSIRENPDTGTISTYCESGVNGSLGKDLREEHRNFYNQNLKENTEPYYWAYAGETVTLKSKTKGSRITEAYWREGTDESARMDCTDGTCSFTVPKGGGVWIHDVKTAEDVKVTITDENDQPIEETYYYGGTLELKASAGTETPDTWTWTVSNPDIAEITNDGSRAAVTFTGTGDVTITAEYSSETGSGNGSVEMTVLPKPVTITADGKSKVYDNDPDTDPELTATVTGKLEKGAELVYSLSRKEGQEAGNYPISVTFDESANPNYVITVSPVRTAEGDYAGKTAEESAVFVITKKPVTITADDKSKVYDNDPDTDPELTAAVKGKPEKGVELIYSLSREEGQEVGNYTITVTADAESNPDYEITAKNGIFSITKEPDPEPPYNRIDFFRLFEETQLPATGFSSLFTGTLPEQPKALNYEPLHLRLQIPTLDLETELVAVPLADNTWQVEWLGSRAGLLEGSALPGDGCSVIAAHNTLNSEEYGPFALLSTMAANDLITVNSGDGTMRLFRVYANELIGADDAKKLAETAEQEADSLVLITCENESVSGSYLSRRVIFAKPL